MNRYLLKPKGEMGHETFGYYRLPAHLHLADLRRSGFFARFTRDSHFGPEGAGIRFRKGQGREPYYTRLHRAEQRERDPGNQEGLPRLRLLGSLL